MWTCSAILSVSLREGGTVDLQVWCGRSRESILGFRRTGGVNELDKSLDEPSDGTRGVFRSNKLSIWKSIGEPHTVVIRVRNLV